VNIYNRSVKRARQVWPPNDVVKQRQTYNAIRGNCRLVEKKIPFLPATPSPLHQRWHTISQPPLSAAATAHRSCHLNLDLRNVLRFVALFVQRGFRMLATQRSRNIVTKVFVRTVGLL